jgi:hypothetical protein
MTTASFAFVRCRLYHCLALTFIILLIQPQIAFLRMFHHCSFCLHLCSTRYVQSKRKEKADFLRLLPLVPPGGLPAAPSRQRTWKLLVVAHDGSARPQAVAVTGACEMRCFVNHTCLQQVMLCSTHLMAVLGNRLWQLQVCVR